MSDDGPGVPPESLERLMRPFYRVDSSRTNPQEGSGPRIVDYPSNYGNL
ncbi:MAG: hypothetical protein ACLUPK_03005 [Veillonella sp.]